MPFVLALFLGSAQLLWIFFLLVGVPLLGLELFLLVSVGSGVRVGDILANTSVTERGHEMLGEPS